MQRKLLFGTVAMAAGLAMAGGTAVAAPTDPPADLAPTRLEVDLSDRELRLYHDGKQVNTYSVAVGESEYPTPRGDFTIDRIIWNPAWVPPNTEWGKEHERQAPDSPDNPMVGAKLFFQYPDYYIHGTDAEHTLGEAESHGCIRMDPQEVLDLAQWVQEHGGEPRDEAWFRSARRDDASKHEISLPSPIPVTIHP